MQLLVPLRYDQKDKDIRRLLWVIYVSTRRAGSRKLGEQVQEKIHYGLLLLKTQNRISTKFVKAIREGLFELRTEYAGNIYRVFFIFDDGQIVVLFNGFQKKTQKTPNSEIEKALKIKEAYYADKQP